jgi:KamA family protein
MEYLANTLQVEFTHSREKVQVQLDRLEAAVVEFLELHGAPPMVDAEFQATLGEGDGEARFQKLLEAAHREGDSAGFFGEVLKQLEGGNDENPASLQVNGVRLPYQLGLTILKEIIPGDRIHDVKSVKTLERLTNIKVPREDRGPLKEVLDRYPVRLSTHVIRQMRLSSAIAYQYKPSLDELDPDGLFHTWVGQFHTGVVERMYRNRVIFVLHMACPVYCRFCFRKHKECRTQRTPTQKHVSMGISYLKEAKNVKEVVLTGGDPFMNRATLTWAVDGLAKIPHIETLRLATRSLSYFPELFTKGDAYWVTTLRRKQLELEQKGKKLEVATHFLHPDEISQEALDVISDLVSDGIPVYVQTPFLGGCNDSGPPLAELFAQLRGAGAEMHYVFMPCSPLQGNGRYRAPISDGLEAAGYLRAHLSDRAVPSFCTATSIGKADWGTSGWLVETDEADPRFIWIRTPYSQEYFEEFSPILDLSQVARPNAEGTLDAQFMAEVGDPRWIRGPREASAFPRSYIPRERFPEEDRAQALARFQEAADNGSMAAPAIVPTGCAALRRVHETRVELDCSVPEEELDRALEMVGNTRELTDVVVHSDLGIAKSLSRISEVVRRMVRLHHVTSVRLRSHLFRSRPETFTEGVIKRLAQMNRLRVANPLRLEVEALFMHPSELRAMHGRVVRLLRQRGVTVYVNIPLLPFINDAPEEMLALNSGCRKLGMELNHLVLAGMPLQEEWNADHPVYVGEVIDLASHLREFGSGRELPAYILRTQLGEVDFGLSCDVLETLESGESPVRLFTYTMEDYRKMDPQFVPPPGVTFGEDGHPVVSMTGLVA